MHKRSFKNMFYLNTSAIFLFVTFCLFRFKVKTKFILEFNSIMELENVKNISYCKKYTKPYIIKILKYAFSVSIQIEMYYTRKLSSNSG